MATMFYFIWMLRATLIVSAFIDSGFEEIDKKISPVEAPKTIPRTTEIIPHTQKHTGFTKPTLNEEKDLELTAYEICTPINKKHLRRKVYTQLKGTRSGNAYLFKIAAKVLVNFLCKQSDPDVVECWFKRIFDTDGDGLLDTNERRTLEENPKYEGIHKYKLHKCRELMNGTQTRHKNNNDKNQRKHHRRQKRQKYRLGNNGRHVSRR